MICLLMLLQFLLSRMTMSEIRERRICYCKISFAVGWKSCTEPDASDFGTSMSRWFAEPLNMSDVYAQTLYKWSIDEHIAKPEKFLFVFVVRGDKFFERKTGVAPYAESGSTYCFGQRHYGFGLVEGVSSRKRDIEVIVKHCLHDLVDAHVVSGSEIPRLRIVTAGARMCAACEIDRRAKSRAIYRCAFNDFNYLQMAVHLCTTRSLSSDSLALFQRSVVPTRYPVMR